MKINRLEVDFNPRRVSDMERYEEALEILGRENREEKASAKLAFECRKVRDFFDCLFGEGAAEKAIDDLEDYDQCFDAARAVIEEVREIQRQTSEKYLQYTPNRAARRAKK